MTTEGAEQTPRNGFLLLGRVSWVLCFAASLLFVRQEKTLGFTSVLFGDTSIERTQDWDTGGMAEAFQVTASAVGTLGTMTVYLDSSSSAEQLFVALNTNADGSSRRTGAEQFSCCLQEMTPALSIKIDE
jgi:hypothetical protein